MQGAFILIKDKVECMFSSIIVKTSLVHVIFVQSTGMYNMINKETWSIAPAHVFFIHLAILKSEKTSSKAHFCSNTLYKYAYLIIHQTNKQNRYYKVRKAFS